MRCDEFRWMIEEAGTGAMPEALGAHLESCSECRAYAQDWAEISKAFRLAATDPLPEASIGFSTRLLRRLAGPSVVERAATEFVERVGKRVAFATMLLAMLTLLALGLPATGPVREPSSAELMAQAYQGSSVNGIVFADDTWMSQASKPAVPESSGEPSQK